MRLLAIRITNFGPFVEEQVFTFPEASGLYFMQGINQVEPRLGSNGAGKSSIWKAMCWCIYGKIPSGLKAGDISNWDEGKGTRVEIDYADDGVPVVWTCARTWGPNSWTLSHVAEMITDEQVIDLTKDKSNPMLEDLRLSFAPFLNCILTAQDQRMFLDEKHDVQAAIFSEVMGLDRWLEYSAKASAKASAQDTITRVLERKESELKGQLTAIHGQDFSVSIKDWDILQVGRVAEIEKEYKDALEKLDRLKDGKPKLTELVEATRLVWAEARAPAGDIERDLKARSRELSDFELQLTLERRDLKAQEEQLEHIIAHDTCPTCNQFIPTKTRNEQKLSGQRAVNKMLAQIERTEKKASQVARAALSLAKVVEDLERTCQTARSRYDDADQELKTLERDILAQNKYLDRLEDDAEKALKLTNPFLGLQEQAIRDRERIEQDLVDTTRLLDDSHSQYSIYSFWVRGFKELRLQLIAEALNELEIEVNSCIEALGLTGWELNFQVDRETKGGSIQRGFSVLVRSPHNQLAVPWEAWSGGEAQRLRLAGNMGLADLIRSRTGADLNIEVWDEPTKNLSDEGIQDLLVSLKERAIREDRQIWVVDHHSHEFGGFTGGATIRKLKTGSVIEQS